MFSFDAESNYNWFISSLQVRIDLVREDDKCHKTCRVVCGPKYPQDIGSISQGCCNRVIGDSLQYICDE